MKTPTRRALVAILALLAAAYVPAAADDSERLLTIDHYLRAQSAQAPAGAAPLLYVRERTKAGVALRGGASANRVVLFVHGAGTPAEVSFDVPYEDYSWMGYLATAGYDVFSVDLTGYGRSWRPAPMNDPCNIPANRQAEFVPALIAAPCAPSSDRHTTTMASDWSDVGVAVDYVRSLRRVTQVNLIGWSQGGPRVGGYAALHPDKVRRMVLLAPLYSRTRSADPPADVPAKGQPFTIQSRTDLVSLWDGQVGCAGQYEAGTLDAIWSEMMASDPVGATWGAGVRRAPNVTPRSRRPCCWSAARTTSRSIRSVCASCSPITAARRRCSSISPARRTTRCGSGITCCCSRRRSNGSRTVRSTDRCPESSGWDIDDQRE